MQVDGASCVCPECGVVCRGKFSGCPDIWQAGSAASNPVVVRAPRPPPPPRLPTPPRPNVPVGRSEQWLTALAASPPIAANEAPAAEPEPARPKRAGARHKEESVKARADASPAAKDESAKLRAEGAAISTILEQSYEKMSAALADRSRALDDQARELDLLAQELDRRVRELDERTEVALEALDHDRVSLPARARQAIASVVPDAVETIVRQAVETRVTAAVRALEQDRRALPEQLRQSVAAALPDIVDEAVGKALDARDPLALLSEPGSTPLRSDHDSIAPARQRSFDKRLDGVVRRAQEIDDRVTTHLRAIDDDRILLADLVRHQDRLAQSVAEIDVAGRYEELTKWVTETVPTMVKTAVKTALGAQAAALSTAVGRAERARADSHALSATIQATSERILEALYRRDQEADDRAASQLSAFEQERAALAGLLEGNRERVEQTVLSGLPVLVNSAVRVSMEAYRSERRSGVEELAARIRADSDVMRETLQRSFEKMMESLAHREQELDERAAAHKRALEHQKAETAELWAKAARSLADALPSMVAEAVQAAGELDRSELEAARQETDRLRVETEAAMADLREALGQVREALGGRDEAVERQAAAYQRAIEGMRAAMARPTATPDRGPTRAPAPAPPVVPVVVAEAVPAKVVEISDDGRVMSGRSTVPRAQRVERRMLKIDDSDAAWPAISRREAALSHFLDGDDE